MTVRCGKCGPCKRWIVSLDKSEVCEMAPKRRSGPYNPERDNAERIERLRALLQRQGERARCAGGVG